MESPAAEHVSSATAILLGSIQLYVVFPLVLSLLLVYLLVAPSYQSVPRESPSSPSSSRFSAQLQAYLLPAPLRNGSPTTVQNDELLEKLQQCYLTFVTFALYHSCFALIVIVMLFRLIRQKWREQSESGIFNTERLRALFYNVREVAFVLGFPALLLIAFGSPLSYFLEQRLLTWTGVPGLEIPRWQLYFALVALSLHVATRLERESFLVYTLIYQARFGRTVRTRRGSMRQFCTALGGTYLDRKSHYYNVKWAPDPRSGRLRPRWRADWYMKGKPGAHPLYDIWRCGSGYAVNIIQFTHNDQRMHVFDYHYCREVAIRWGAGILDFVTERAPRDCTIACVELPCDLPALSIYPETLWDEIAKFGGGIDLDMESMDFSDRYRVWARDRRFATAVCNARMMEFLSAHPGLALRIAGTVLALRMPGLVPVENLAQFRDWTAEARSLVPGFVLADAAQAQEND